MSPTEEVAARSALSLSLLPISHGRRRVPAVPSAAAVTADRPNEHFAAAVAAHLVLDPCSARGAAAAAQRSRYLDSVSGYLNSVVDCGAVQPREVCEAAVAPGGGRATMGMNGRGVLSSLSHHYSQGCGSYTWKVIQLQ